MINTLGKTHIKKWSDDWSEPLRKKKKIYFYDLKENYRTSQNIRKINNTNCLLYSVLVNIDQQKMLKIREDTHKKKCFFLVAGPLRV